jgi:SET domain-containing protein
MLHVNASPGSAVHGTGLFVREPVSEGALVYDASGRFTVVIPVAEIGLFPPALQEQMGHYVYDGVAPYHLTDAVYYNTDDSRFMNHADHPSCVYDPATETYVAARNLESGEELTCNYRDFCTPGKWSATFLGP